MPGRLEHLEPDPPELDRLPVGERGEGVLGLGPRAQEDLGADPVAELQVAGEEVGVEVREEDMLDPAAHGLGVCEVLVDVALRVDHRRHARRSRRRQVGGVRQTAKVVLLENHAATIARAIVLSGTRATIGCSYRRNTDFEGGGYE